MNHCGLFYALLAYYSIQANLRLVLLSFPSIQLVQLLSTHSIVSVYDTSPVKMFGGFLHWSPFFSKKKKKFKPSFSANKILSASVSSNFYRRIERLNHDFCEYFGCFSKPAKKIVCALFDRRRMRYVYMRFCVAPSSTVCVLSVYGNFAVIFFDLFEDSHSTVCGLMVRVLQIKAQHFSVI